MIYAQFFQYSALDGKTLIEACGDRSVIILDGRENHVTHSCIAKHECIKRGYVAWQLFRGETFTRSSSVSSINRVE